MAVEIAHARLPRGVRLGTLLDQDVLRDGGEVPRGETRGVSGVGDEGWGRGGEGERGGWWRWGTGEARVRFAGGSGVQGGIRGVG